MRLIRFLFLVQMVVGDFLQDRIAQAPIEIQQKIFDLLQSKSSSRSELVDPAENWCCKIKPSIQAVQKTRLTTFYILQAGKHRCGYDSCGFLGFGRCTRWCQETWTETQTKVESFLVYTQNVCPDDQVICCAQHIYVLGHCFSYEEIANNQLLLAQLSELGLVVPGPSIG